MKWRPLCDADMGGGGDGGAGQVPGSLLGADDAPGEGGEQNAQVDQGQQGEQQGQAAESKQESAFQPFTLPEGVEYDEASSREFQTLAKELGLNQEQAQKLVDFHAKKYLGEADEFNKRLMEERGKWEEQCKNHPEFGGAKFSESLGYARNFIKTFGGDELKGAMDIIGDHPALFSAFAKAGKLLAEDRFVQGSGGGVDRTFSGVAKTMYPDMN